MLTIKKQVVPCGLGIVVKQWHVMRDKVVIASFVYLDEAIKYYKSALIEGTTHLFS